MGAAPRAIGQQLDPNRKAMRQEIALHLSHVCERSQRITSVANITPVARAWIRLACDAWSHSHAPEGYARLKPVTPFYKGMLEAPFLRESYWAAADALIALEYKEPPVGIIPLWSRLEELETLIEIVAILDLHLHTPYRYSHLHRVHQALQKEAPAILASFRLLLDDNKFKTRAVLDNGSQ